MRKQLLSALLPLALIVGGCGSSDPGIATRVDEYGIELGSSSAPEGEVEFSVRNDGEVAHQLVVLRTKQDADDLPVKDGVVRTDAKGIDEVGSIQLLASGASESLRVDLEAGSYVLICNIAGHYPSGMHAPFRVR